MSAVQIVEVGPRDGLQSVPTWVPTEDKVAFIRALLRAGVSRFEMGSFVSPKAIPQMKDIRDVIAGLGPLGDVRPMVLVPNTRGARDAVEAGMNEIIYVVSMSESHNQSNVRRPVQQSIDDLGVLCREVDPDGKLRLRIGLATSFDCPFEGRTPEANVLRNIEQILAIREDVELVLSDTTGFAMPDHVGGLAKQCIAQFGDKITWGFHGHDTLGFAVSNVLAGHEAGLTVFDGSAAGLGGCPFAPGATGNVATEDLIYLFHRMGVDTGIDLDLFLEAADMAAKIPNGVTGGHIRQIPRERLKLEGPRYAAE